jgi:O-antigen/teichoic acid export membrane protein
MQRVGGNTYSWMIPRAVDSPTWRKRGEMVQLGKSWKQASWALLDKSLILVFGVAFMLLVVAELPDVEFGLQVIAATVVLTLAPLLRFLFLVPMTKFVAEGHETRSTVATGTLLYVGATLVIALLLVLGRPVWAGIFGKPALAAVLVPSAVLMVAGSLRDASIAALEGHRLLRRLFFADLGYYTIAIGALVAWRLSDVPRDAVTIQWVQAVAAGAGSLIGAAVSLRLLAGRPSTRQAQRIGRFGAYSFGSALGATAGQQADSLLAGALLQEQGVASYGAAKLFFRLFNVLSQAINQVTMPLVSKLQAEKRHAELRVLYEKGVWFLTLVLVPGVILLMALAGPLYALFYGERYVDSVPVFRILLLGALALPWVSIGAPFLMGLGQVRKLAVHNWIATLVAIALALWWMPLLGAQGAAWATTGGRLVLMLTLTSLLAPQLGVRLRDLPRRTGDITALVRQLWTRRQG